MNILPLPNELEEECNSINREISPVLDSWNKCNDENIPLNKAHEIRVCCFVIAVIDYVLANSSSLDIAAYKEFLRYYFYNFYYGPNGDDSVYITSICDPLMELEVSKSLDDLKKCKSDLLKAIQYVEKEC